MTKIMYLAKKYKNNNCGALRKLVPFVQFKKREKHPRRSVSFSKVGSFSLQLYQKYHFSMAVFHVFKIVKMVPNCATHHIY